MRRLARRLVDEGFTVDNSDYPSRTDRIEPLARGDRAGPPARGFHRRPGPFVTHSMGGMLVRAYLQQNKIDRLGRVVMLAPPNQGTEVVDYYNLRAPFLGRMLRSVLGPASGQMRTDAEALPARLGPANFEVGIIDRHREPQPGLWPRHLALAERRHRAGGTHQARRHDGLPRAAVHAYLHHGQDGGAGSGRAFLQHGRFRREAAAELAATP